jgi:colanic acid biosynthesis glycosyl transferase WcaI
MKSDVKRTRLLVLNQYYAPGVEATAHLLSQLCEALSDEFDVTVITGMLRDEPELHGSARIGNVDVLRVRSTSFERRRLSLRAINYLTYLVQSLKAALLVERPDVVLCMTDPPIIANVALIVARRFRAPLVVVSQDVFPEAAVELKRLQNPILISLLRGLIGYYLRRAECVVAIGETMRTRLQAKGAAPDRLEVIANWVDTNALRPNPRKNRWAIEHGLENGFVVMHSGNIGHAQDLDSLVRAATFLRDLGDLNIVIIGGGARRHELLALAERLEVERIQFLPYQDRALLSESLSAADIHVVGLARGLSGYVVPSRLYGILAVSRPVIVAADPESETAQVVSGTGSGLVVPPGRPELLAGAIRRAHAGELDLEGMGERGREYVTREADKLVAVGRYRGLLRDLAARR